MHRAEIPRTKTSVCESRGPLSLAQEPAQKCGIPEGSRMVQVILHVSLQPGFGDSFTLGVRKFFLSQIYCIFYFIKT